MPLQMPNRQVNPLMAALLQRIQAGQQQQQMPQTMPMNPQTTPRMPIPQVGQPGLLNQQPGTAGGATNPALMAMLAQRMQGAGAGQGQPQAGQGGATPQDMTGGYGQLLQQFLGGMPRIDLSRYQLPNFNWMPTANG